MPAVKMEDDTPQVPWPEPTSEQMAEPIYDAIWRCIKTWDIAVPGAYSGYSGATGNHVRAIMDAIHRMLAP
jgi:hypothetical protein